MAEKVVSEQSEFDYAYKVIDAIVEAMDRVTTKPEYARVFVGDLLQKMPDLIDALMMMTFPEHRPKLSELLRASSRMGAEWVKRIKV